jgi:exodeoxyribonuclease VIII
MTARDAMPMQAGAFHGLAAKTYHGIEAMSFHGSTAILRSPAHFRLARDTTSEPTDAQVFGSAVHALVLEGETAFAEAFVVAPTIDRRTKAGKAEYAEFLLRCGGREPIDKESYARALRCAEAVTTHPAASRLLYDARREVSLFWEDGEYKVPCKARLDALGAHGIVDLKTCRDASPEAFARSAASFGYHRQGAHYWSGVEHVLGHSPEFFVLIAVEDEPPHGVACYALPPVAIQAGRREMDEALARYRAALAGGKWTGYDSRVIDLDLPRYALRDSKR